MSNSDIASLITAAIGRFSGLRTQPGVTGPSGRGGIESFQDFLDRNLRDIRQAGVTAPQKDSTGSGGWQTVAANGRTLPSLTESHSFLHSALMQALQTSPGTNLNEIEKPTESGVIADQTKKTADEILDYWTPERIAGAKPAPMPSLPKDVPGPVPDSPRDTLPTSPPISTVANPLRTVENGVSASTGSGKSDAEIRQYWTPERVADAKPYPLPGLSVPADDRSIGHPRGDGNNATDSGNGRMPDILT